MTAGEGIELLNQAEFEVDGRKPWKPNSVFTWAHAIDIIRAGLTEMNPDTELSRLMERRVLQAAYNQKRPVLGDGRR